MACNTCAKPFTVIRKEKGCPGCGFSYCSNCLNNKVFVPKLNAEAKVCAKCKRCPSSDKKKKIIPPDVYFKRMAAMGPEPSSSSSQNLKDQEILHRLQNLKKGKSQVIPSGNVTEGDIANRLRAIRGEVASVSDEELNIRLAKLRGHSTPVAQNKSVLLAPDVRTEQDQINDLLKEYMEQFKIDSTYRDKFNKMVNDIEARAHKLKNPSNPQPVTQGQQHEELSDEEAELQKIIEKVKAESLLDDDGDFNPTNDELPFCEICNEDAAMRCLGCKYLFCKRCFMEHRNDDDCDRYVPYKPPTTMHK